MIQNIISDTHKLNRTQILFKKKVMTLLLAMGRMKYHVVSPRNCTKRAPQTSLQNAKKPHPHNCLYKMAHLCL